MPSTMSKKVNTDLSRITVDAMDLIGYSKEMVESRAELARRIISNAGEAIKQLNTFCDLDIILTGSRAEGTTKLREGDLDIMCVLRNFLCVDNDRRESELNVIQTLSTYSSPGYTKLNPLDMGCDSFGAMVLGLTCTYDLNRGQMFVSSTCVRNFFDCFRSTISYEGTESLLKEQKGPSLPISITLHTPTIPYLKVQTVDVDYVLAMPYLPSTLLDVWKKRSRKWPPPHLCQEVSETEGFVVPVGPSCSEEQNFEWRICFTTAEKIIVSHLNSVQLKLYILLKMVFKKIIKPSNDIISSYMIKNILFWVAEVNDSNLFTPNKLIDLLLHCLAFLRECLHSNFLPNYMIPSRNLLVGKGTPQDKARMKATLTDLLEDGGCIVMRIEALRNSVLVIGQSPNIARRYSEVRNNVEKLVLRVFDITGSYLSPKFMLQPTSINDVLCEIFNDPAYFEIVMSLLNLLNIDLVSLEDNPDHCFGLLCSFLR